MTRSCSELMNRVIALAERAKPLSEEDQDDINSARSIARAFASDGIYLNKRLQNLMFNDGVILLGALDKSDVILEMDLLEEHMDEFDQEAIGVSLEMTLTTFSPLLLAIRNTMIRSARMQYADTREFLDSEFESGSSDGGESAKETEQERRPPQPGEADVASKLTKQMLLTRRQASRADGERSAETAAATALRARQPGKA